jgi:hypothetical protein
MERVKVRVKGIPATVAWGIGLLTLGLCLIGVSLFSHFSIFAIVGTWVLFFSSGIGGWLLGRGTKR